MKKLIHHLSILAILLGLGQIAFLGTRTIPLPSASPAEKVDPEMPSRPRGLFPDFAVGAVRSVDLDLEGVSEELGTDRERKDQALDWILFALIHASSLPIEEINQVLYDIPPVRYGYVQPIGNLEFGTSRSRTLADGICLALIPVGLSKEARWDAIAEVADRERKDQGSEPGTIHVFEYDLDLAAGQATVGRAKDIGQAEAFGKESGYHSAVVRNLDDLKEWLALAQDITSVEIQPGGLRIGGRSPGGKPYRGITVEEVAAIWQSEDKIAKRMSSLEEKVKRWTEALNAAGKPERRKYSGRSPYAGLLAQYSDEPIGGGYSPPYVVHTQEQMDRESAKMNAAIKREAEGLVDGSGFSLDPEFVFPELIQEWYALDSLVGDEGAGAFTHADHLRILADLRRSETGSLLDLINALKSREGTLATGETIRKKIFACRIQAARYDGEMQGTETGMVLFYTDLLAKLWMFNYQGKAPSRQIPDFLPETHIQVSSALWEYENKYSSARLWFGPNESGFQSAGQDGNILNMGRIATKVFARNSDPLHPGEEVSAGGSSQVFLGWWNDHYQEVAQYEQEYERLNEIMKWSIVIGWLNGKQEGNRLGYLQDHPVAREHWFPSWVSRNKRLRFNEWDSVHFLPGRHGKKGTEAIPLLQSDTFSRGYAQLSFSGGVSLASKQVLQARSGMNASVPNLLRRSRLDYSKASGPNPLYRTVDGAEIVFGRPSPHRASTTYSLKPGSVLQGRFGQVANQGFEKTTTVRHHGMDMDFRIGGRHIGSLAIDRSGNGFKVGWRARDMDLARSLSGILTQGPLKHINRAMLELDSRVDCLVLLPGEGGYLVKAQGSRNWFLMKEEVVPSVEMAGWADFRAGSSWSSEGYFNVKLVSPEQLGEHLPKGAEWSIKYSGSRKRPIPILEPAELLSPADPKPFAVRIGGREVEGVVDATGGVRLRGSDPRLGETWSLADFALSTPAGRFADLSKSVRGADAKAHFDQSDFLSGSRYADGILAGDYRRAAHEVAKHSAGLKQKLGEGMQSETARVRQYFHEKAFGRAHDLIDRLVEISGETAELLILRGVAKIRRGRLAEGDADFMKALSGPEGKGGQVLDRINEEIAGSRGLPAGERLTYGKGAAPGQVSKEYWLPDGKLLKPVTPEEFAKVSAEGPRLFVEDSPRFANQDFSAPLGGGAGSPLSGGKIYRYDNTRVADLDPSVLYMRKLDPAGRARRSRHTREEDVGTDADPETGGQASPVSSEAPRRFLPRTLPPGRDTSTLALNRPRAIYVLADE